MVRATPWVVVPFMKSSSVKKRKEKLFHFPNNVGKLNIQAKRSTKLPFKELWEDDEPLSDSQVNKESLEEEASSVGSLKAVETSDGVAGFHFAEQNKDGSFEVPDVVETFTFRTIHDSCELAKRKRPQSEMGVHDKQVSSYYVESKGLPSNDLGDIETCLGSLSYEHNEQQEQMHDDIELSAKAVLDPIHGCIRESYVLERGSAQDAPVGVNSFFTQTVDCGTHPQLVSPFGNNSLLNAGHTDPCKDTWSSFTAPCVLSRSFLAGHVPVDPTVLSTPKNDVVCEVSLDKTSGAVVISAFNDGQSNSNVATRPPFILPSNSLAGHDLVVPTGTSNNHKDIDLAEAQKKTTPYEVTSALNSNGFGQLNVHFETDQSFVNTSNPDKAVHYHLGDTQGQERNVTGGAQCKSWASLFKSEGQNVSKPQIELGSDLDLNHRTTDNSKEFNLEFVDHGGTEDDLVLKIPKDLTAAGKDEWTATLVGRFLGRKLPFSLVSNVTERLWANEGLIDTLATDSGCFFFSFASTEARDAILEGGPWFVAGQPLLLRPWKPHFSFGNEEVHSVPIWVNFYGLPLEYWNPKGISFISSFIGKPIRVDRITASRRRITYARVCIEVSAEFDFFNEFHIESEDEETGNPIRTKINLEYQWTPVRCKKCSQFGHDCSRSASLGPSHQDRHPLKRKAKEKGTWQVVSGKDKGKKTIVDHTSDRTKSTNGLVTTPAKENRFEALSLLLEDPDPKPAKVDTIVSPSARTSCPVASSSYQEDVPRGETREDTTFPVCVDDEDDCISASDIASEDGTPLRESHLSNRQKKKAAKMKFRGSRPKGRQRS